jgi:DNA-directed RNA polymerase specialized sigma24 family protein
LRQCKWIRAFSSGRATASAKHAHGGHYPVHCRAAPRSDRPATLAGEGLGEYNRQCFLIDGPRETTDVTDGGSVTRCIDGLRAGDADDIQRLWDRYFERLVRLARDRLPGHSRRASDEEDVALSAFHSFCARASQGQFPRLEDRDDLWRVLFTITARKAVASVRHATRQKRGGGRVPVEDGEGDDGLAQALSREPSPEDVARFTEDYHALLERLTGPALRTIAVRRLEGHSSEEIAAELGITARTVDRKLQLIQAIWSEGLET